MDFFVVCCDILTRLSNMPVQFIVRFLDRKEALEWIQNLRGAVQELFFQKNKSAIYKFGANKCATAEIQCSRGR